MIKTNVDFLGPLVEAKRAKLHEFAAMRLVVEKLQNEIFTQARSDQFPTSAARQARHFLEVCMRADNLDDLQDYLNKEIKRGRAGAEIAQTILKWLPTGQHLKAILQKALHNAKTNYPRGKEQFPLCDDSILKDSQLQLAVFREYAVAVLRRIAE